MKIIGGAISSRRSQPVFLEGSFGSGKSQFGSGARDNLVPIGVVQHHGTIAIATPSSEPLVEKIEAVLDGGLTALDKIRQRV